MLDLSMKDRVSNTNIRERSGGVDAIHRVAHLKLKGPDTWPRVSDNRWMKTVNRMESATRCISQQRKFTHPMVARQKADPFQLDEGTPEQEGMETITGSLCPVVDEQFLQEMVFFLSRFFSFITTLIFLNTQISNNVPLPLVLSTWQRHYRSLLNNLQILHICSSSCPFQTYQLREMRIIYVFSN